MSKHTLDPADYIRMFAGNSAFSHLLSEAFLHHYKELGVAAVQDEQTWMSFIPKSSQEKTLKEGKKLYSTKAMYEEYKQGFNAYQKRSAERFESILQQETLTAEDVAEALNLIAEHFSYYSKTEFFYTNDLTHEDMVISIQEFDALKLGGRSYLNKIIFEETGYIRSILKKISSQLGVPVSDLFQYSMSELPELVRTGSAPDRKLIDDRSIFFMSGEYTVAGDESRGIVNEFLSSYRDLSRVIKGTIANKGKVQGKARVIPADFKEFDKMSKAVADMQEGEILVAETTAPEIIQACKKASAIITNQGGMLSHAAIVSRELGIPCIVGTDKDVTLNIKTGDMLDVDATTGIIRIL